MPERDENMIAALRRERAGYVAAGKADRVEQVDEQLKLHGYEGEPEPAVDPSGGPAGRTPRSGRQRTTAADSGKPAADKGTAGK